MSNSNDSHPTLPRQNLLPKARPALRPTPIGQAKVVPLRPQSQRSAPAPRSNIPDGLTAEVALTASVACIVVITLVAWNRHADANAVLQYVLRTLSWAAPSTVLAIASWALLHRSPWPHIAWLNEFLAILLPAQATLLASGLIPAWLDRRPVQIDGSVVASSAVMALALLLALHPKRRVHSHPNPRASSAA